jgi:septal ring factor EnvC (AmiA/AmiB activator)
MELTSKHLEAIERTVAIVVGLTESIQELKTDMASVKETLNSHTSSLDAISRDVKNWNTEIVAVRARLDRHDQWFKQIAESIHLQLQ